ncbi:MAG: ThiF family adenylyltransferase [Flavobacteriales bacterium]|nr:ThiF family adenylyltransferase [Flavobacteriales bacterium]
MLSPEELNRYARHISLDKVGLAGQEKLKKAKVLVIGAGGLGCPALMYLCASGIGTIGIMDHDIVEIHNLQRQVLFNGEDLGKNKAIATKETLEKMNPLISIEAIPFALTSRNALDLFKRYDLVIDGTDNYGTRYLVNDASVITDTPLVYGAIYKFEGHISVFNYKKGPSYRCLYPKKRNTTNLSCSDVGVLGILPGIVGTQQACEAIKIILGFDGVLSGTIMTYNALIPEYRRIQLERNEAQIEKAKIVEATFEQAHADSFCDLPIIMSKQISRDDFFSEKTQNDVILDVREVSEKPDLDFTTVINIPLDQLKQRVNEIPKEKRIFVICQKGVRSLKAVSILESLGYDYIINVKNGMIG